MSELKRISIFVLHDEDSTDFDWVCAWLDQWKTSVTIVDYSTGGWEHLWNIEAPQAAVNEVPEDFLCASAWATPALFEQSSIWQKLKRFVSFLN